MIVYLEGPDNSGKSTLAKRLSEELGVEVRTRPEGFAEDVRALDHMGASNRVYDQVRGEIAKASEINDRCYIISERVYGKILRNEELLYPYAIYLNMLKKVDAIIIYCRPPWNIIKNNGERDQMEGVIEHHRQIVVEYDNVMNECIAAGINVIPYDWTQEDQYETILEFITGAK